MKFQHLFDTLCKYWAIIFFGAVALTVIVIGCSGRQNPGDYREVPEGKTNRWSDLNYDSGNFYETAGIQNPYAETVILCKP